MHRAKTQTGPGKMGKDCRGKENAAGLAPKGEDKTISEEKDCGVTQRDENLKGINTNHKSVSRSPSSCKKKVTIKKL